MEKEFSQDFIKKTVLCTVEIGKNLITLLATGAKSKKSKNKPTKISQNFLKNLQKSFVEPKKIPKIFPPPPPRNGTVTLSKIFRPPPRVT